MGNSEFDLKAFREGELQITQAKLAQLTNVRQDAISRYEKDPAQIPLWFLVRLAEVAGQSPNQLIRYQPSVWKELTVERTWTGRHRAAALQSKLAAFRDAMPDTERSAPESWALLDGLEQTIIRKLHKPTIGVMGGAGSGKGTLINGLLGQQAIPTGAGFTLPVPIRIRHIEDRPVSMEDSVYILRKASGTAGEDEPLEPRVLASGGFGTLLDWGGSGSYKRRLPEVGSILIFLDSDILKNCDMVKFPSLPDGKIWTGIQTDILVYLLPVTGTIGAMETLRCKVALENLWVDEQYDQKSKPLSNLFFVVSKAHLAGNIEEAKAVMKEMGTYIYNTLPSSYWKPQERPTGHELGLDEFLSRFFLHTTFAADWCEKFEQEFRRCVETLPKVFERTGIQEVDNYRNMACRILDAELQRGWKEQREAFSSLVTRVESGETDNWAAVTQKRDKVIDAIRACRLSSQDAFKQRYLELLRDPDAVSPLSDDSTQQCSASQLQQVGARLNSELERQMREILLQARQSLSVPLDEYFAAFEERVSGSGFLVRENYAQALQREKGAMAWQTTAQEVSVDAGLLRTAGEATRKYVTGADEVYTEYEQPKESSLIKSIGYGVGIGAGILGGVLSAGMSLAVGAGVAAALAAENPTRKSRLRTRIMKVYTREDVLEKYILCMDQYWEDTLSAFCSASDRLEQDWTAYFDRLSKDVREGEETMAKRMRATESVRNFLESLSV